MKYYIVDDSLEENVVGKDYPQAYNFIKGYNPEAPEALFSLYELGNRFPDYTPNIDGLMLSGYAKLTDFVSTAFSPDMFVLSDRVKTLFEAYNLCPHRFYPVGLYKRKVKQNYHMLHVLSYCYLDYIDFERSSFILKSRSPAEKSSCPISLKSKADFMEQDSKLVQKAGVMWQTIRATKIVMTPDFDKELDFFFVFWVDTNLYISERLKNAIESNGMTGWIFTPATNLIVE
ncbi:imm11 family protein [Bacteroides heparinolyticus]|uniref:imm11 family protein n=2 Tax=Prevotella heparinolytica TaxID=28113 RepID=UPI0035A092BB